MEIQVAEVHLISRKLDLDIDKTKLLLEEPSDVDLVLYQIAERFTKKDLKKLSFNLAAKILIYQKAKNKGFDFQEQNFISDALIRYWPQIKKNPTLKSDITYSSDPAEAQLQLILYGFSKREYGTPHLVMIQKGLNKKGFYLLSSRIEDWISILRDINPILKACNTG